MPKQKPPRRTRRNSTFKVPDAQALERAKKKRVLKAASERQQQGRRKRVRKARDSKKEALKFAREFHSVERVEWVKRRPCRGCWSLDFAVENHHTKGEGTSRRGHYSTIIPLCQPCHREWHQHGRATFEAKHKMDATLEAERLEEMWQQELTRTAA